MKKNQYIDLTIDSLAFGGAGVARHEGTVYFVKHTVPGDTIKALITRKKRNYREGILEEVIVPSEHRVDPHCQYFGSCGGCSWQNTTYEEQIHQKSKIVSDSLIRIGKLDINTIHPALESPLLFNYRNKMEFSFSSSRWLTKDEISMEDAEIKDKNFAFGLHSPGRFDKVLDIDSCPLQHAKANAIYEVMKEASAKSGCTAYNHKEHTGFFRNFLIRYSFANDELMAMLITNKVQSEEEQAFMDYYKNEFVKLFREQDTLLHGINATNSPVDIQKIELISGKGYITEKILDIEYRISPQSFFQTNSSQLNGFISRIIDAADLQGDEVVWDLYCGAGSITLPASRKCKEIIGIELVEPAIADAIENAKRNNIHNTKFYCEDLHKKQLPPLLTTLPKPDVIIVDPPRAGMHKNIVEHIATLSPERLVYVSCNPTTQARDLELLKDLYTVEEMTPVDLFPHTYHVESICKLRRK